LAPFADLTASGLITGQIFVKSWNGCMEQHIGTFTGCVPKPNGFAD